MVAAFSEDDGGTENLGLPLPRNLAVGRSKSEELPMDKLCWSIDELRQGNGSSHLLRIFFSELETKKPIRGLRGGSRGENSSQVCSLFYWHFFYNPGQLVMISITRHTMAVIANNPGKKVFSPPTPAAAASVKTKINASSTLY